MIWVCRDVGDKPLAGSMVCCCSGAKHNKHCHSLKELIYCFLFFFSFIMDNCDLEKLHVSGGKLHPNFSPELTDYSATVESSVTTVTLDLLTSDCGASCHVVGSARDVSPTYYYHLNLT